MASNASRASALVKVLQAAIEGDDPSITELCTEDLRVWTPAMSASTRAEVLAGLGERDDLLSYSEPDVVPLDVSGPYAAAEWSVTLTRRREPGGDGPSDAPLQLALHGAAVAEFRGEQICALRLYWDEAAVLDGLAPEAAGS